MEGKVTIDGNAQSIATLIALVAAQAPEKLIPKPDLYCSPKNYDAAIEAAKNPDSGITLIDGVPHYAGYRLVRFNNPYLK